MAESKIPKRPHVNHGMRASREYSIWSSMKTRCYNPRAINYRHYGGRGIRMCEAWRKGFMAFYLDMGPCPSPKYEVDRVDNDGPYELSNCVWTTRTQNNRKTRRNHYLTLNGITQCIEAWAEQLGTTGPTIRGRLRRGWEVSRALTPNHDKVSA